VLHLTGTVSVPAAPIRRRRQEGSQPSSPTLIELPGPFIDSTDESFGHVIRLLWLCVDGADTDCSIADLAPKVMPLHGEVLGPTRQPLLCGQQQWSLSSHQAKCRE